MALLTRGANVAGIMTSRTLGGFYSISAVFERLAQPFEPMRRHSGSSSSKSTPWCARDTSLGVGTWPPPINPTAELVWCGMRHGRVVATAIRSPVRPATQWRRVVSRGFRKGHLLRLGHDATRWKRRRLPSTWPREAELSRLT